MEDGNTEKDQRQHPDTVTLRQMEPVVARELRNLRITRQILEEISRHPDVTGTAHHRIRAQIHQIALAEGEIEQAVFGARGVS